MANEQKSYNFKTPRQFVEDFPAFSMGSIRNLIFFENENGLKAAGVVKRIKKKIILDVDAFWRWVDMQNTGKS